MNPASWCGKAAFIVYPILGLCVHTNIIRQQEMMI